jgi:hypothetical protein
MKRLIATLLGITIYIGLSAQYTITSNDVSIDENGVITGCSYNFEQTDIIIPSEIGNTTVRAIGMSSIWGGVFQEEGITSIQLPSTLEYIGDLAFYGNPITSLDIPEGVKKIGRAAFNNCDIVDLTLPQSIQYLGRSCFASNQINELDIPGSLKVLEEYVFERNEITNLNITDGVEHIRYAAFWINNIDTLYLPNSVNFIGRVAFASNSIDTLKLPNNIRHIGNQSFHANNIKNLHIPQSVNIIGAYSFQANEIKHLTIPYSVTEIWGEAFANNLLEDVTYEPLSKLKHVGSGGYKTTVNYYDFPLPDTIHMEGYIFQEWRDNYGVVTEVSDDYGNYYAKGIETGYEVSGNTNLAVGYSANDYVLISIDGDISQTIIASETDGKYSFRVDSGRSITITPKRYGYTFTPESITLNNIKQDMPNQDFNVTQNSDEVIIPTGINKIKAVRVSLYPNPASDYILLQTTAEIGNYFITDISGRTVQSGNLTSKKIDLSGLSNGVFFIYFTDNLDQNMYGKFIKR